jgi:hypothetical protein
MARKMVKLIHQDIAIFVKTVTTIQKSLIKFALGFIWLFIGKICEAFEAIQILQDNLESKF